MSENTYEEYPLSIFCLTIVTTLFSYLLGSLILYFVGGLLPGIAYLIISLMSLFLSMRLRCVFCHYYDKRCSSGMGILSSFLFKQRDNADFSNPKNVTPVAIISFSILFLPLITAIIFLLLDFSFILLLLSLFYLAISIVLGFYLRKNLVCKYCQQGKLGCPGYEGMKGKSLS